MISRLLALLFPSRPPEPVEPWWWPQMQEETPEPQAPLSKPPAHMIPGPWCPDCGWSLKNAPKRDACPICGTDITNVRRDA